jgi:hypothetical protein
MTARERRSNGGVTLGEQMGVAVVMDATLPPEWQGEEFSSLDGPALDEIRDIEIKLEAFYIRTDGRELNAAEYAWHRRATYRLAARRVEYAAEIGESIPIDEQTLLEARENKKRAEQAYKVLVEQYRQTMESNKALNQQVAELRKEIVHLKGTPHVEQARVAVAFYQAAKKTLEKYYFLKVRNAARAMLAEDAEER